MNEESKNGEERVLLVSVNYELQMHYTFSQNVSFYIGIWMH